MKKLLLGVLAITTIFSLAACQKEEKKIDETQTSVEQNNPSTQAPEVTDGETNDAQTEVATTAEETVALALEQHYKTNYPDAVEEVVTTSVKIYSAEEIAENELLKDYSVNEGDIVFEANYELKIVDGYEDLIQFTAATGEIDGSWIRNKYNVGIVRTNGENGYSIDAFGTAF